MALWTGKGDDTDLIRGCCRRRGDEWNPRFGTTIDSGVSSELTRAGECEIGPRYNT